MPGLLKPMRLIRAWCSGSRKRRGDSFPSCGFGVNVPASICPKPRRPRASMVFASLSRPAARPTGFGNVSPANETGLASGVWVIALRRPSFSLPRNPAIERWCARSASSLKRMDRAAGYRELSTSDLWLIRRDCARLENFAKSDWAFGCRRINGAIALKNFYFASYHQLSGCTLGPLHFFSPAIRSKDDSGSFARTDCGFGRPLIEKIENRSFDLLIGPRYLLAAARVRTVADFFPAILPLSALFDFAPTGLAVLYGNSHFTRFQQRGGSRSRDEFRARYR